ERDLRADEHRDAREQAEREKRVGAELRPALQVDAEPHCRKARSGGRERGERCERRPRRLVRRELVRKELCERVGIAELGLVAVGEMVGRLVEDAAAQAAADADIRELALELGEVAHAITDSTACEKVRHSSLRTARASRPLRVSRYTRR